MSDTTITDSTGEEDNAPPRELPPAAQRALAEAEARRRDEEEARRRAEEAKAKEGQNGDPFNPYKP